MIHFLSHSVVLQSGDNLVTNAVFEVTHREIIY